MIALDLDGTLFDTDPRIDYDQHSSIKSHSTPREDAIELVLALADPDRLCVVTGRGQSTRAVTRAQLDDAGLEDVPLRVMPRFTGMADMATWKAAQLEDLDAQIYVGDHPADEAAARQARVPFLHAKTLHLLARLHADKPYQAPQPAPPAKALFHTPEAHP